MRHNTRGPGAAAALAAGLATVCGVVVLLPPLPQAFALPQTASARVLLATVHDRANQPVVDLDADDFVIEEDGRPREVFSVHVADYPIVLLIDAPPSPAERATIRSAAARFLRRVGEDRAVAVGTLTNPPVMIASFDDGRRETLERLDGQTDTTPGASGAAAPVEAMTHAAALVRAVGAPFSAIVVVWNPPAVDEARAEGSAPFAPILDSRAIVHVVSRAAAPAEPQLRAADWGLRELTAQTGGQFTTIYASGSYSVALDRIADRMATEMMVEFLVPAGGTGGLPVRAGVKIPGARVMGLRVTP